MQSKSGHRSCCLKFFRRYPFYGATACPSPCPIHSWHQQHNSHQWDTYPRGAAVQLIEYFVERLIKQEDIQQLAEIGIPRRQKIGALRSLMIRAQEFRSRRPFPKLCPGLEASQIFWVPGGIVHETGIGGVTEGPQHASEIFERALLGPPNRQRPGRFAFKIQDHEIGFYAEHLSEMVVAVNSDSLYRREITIEGAETIENLTAAAEHRSRNLDYFIGQVRQTLLQQVQHAGGVLSYAGKLRVKIHIS